MQTPKKRTPDNHFIVIQRAAKGKRGVKHKYFILSFFTLWLLVEGTDYFDPDIYNSLFRDEMASLLPNVKDVQRRQSILKMRDFNWTESIRGHPDLIFTSDARWP